MARIVIVEDEPTLAETLQYNLEKAGHQTMVASEGYQALELIQREKPDLVILDLMLPGLDGIEICRQVRRTMYMPILILTARDEEIDKVLGLELGADDYMTKPFSMRELLARVHALLRRVEYAKEATTSDRSNLSEQRLAAGELVIDLNRREVLLRGSPVPLKLKEYDLLVYFVRNRGKVLTRQQILEDVWGWNFIGESRTVDVHVHWLREKIEEDPSTPRYIVTVRNVGYRFDG